MRNLVSMVLTSLLLLACQERKAEIIDLSPGRSVEIRISGTKPSYFDPFTVDIRISGYGSKETVTTQIHSENLDTDNVLFDWVSENECIFTFIQQDRSVRRMHLHIADGAMTLKELDQMEGTDL